MKSLTIMLYIAIVLMFILVLALAYMVLEQDGKIHKLQERVDTVQYNINK